MSHTAWSVLLQWSRLGFGALLFLIAARHLTLAEIGAFATAFAPVRLLQMVLRAGVGDLAVLRSGPDQHNAVFALSAGLGLVATTLLAGAGLALPEPVGPMLMTLAPGPLLLGLSLPAEATLRQRLNIRALALRSFAAQGTAAGIALLALYQGAGAWSLVCFALINTALSGALSLWLARVWPSGLPASGQIRALLPDLARLSLRDLANSATLPILQLMISAALGLTAAGAFQIASRIIGLTDALAIAPIRYVALPRFAALSARALPGALQASLRHTATIAALIYPLAALLAPELLTLAIGPDHTDAILPLIWPLALAGLCSALSMPLVQALTAASAIHLTTSRTLILCALSLTLALPGLSLSPFWTATALPVAGLFTLIWFFSRGLPAAGLTGRDAWPPVVAPLVMILTISILTWAFSTLNPENLILSLTLKLLAGAGLCLITLRLRQVARKPEPAT